MRVHHATDVIAEAVDILCEELDGIVARHFAADRTIRVEGTPTGWYCATIEGRLVFPPCPNLDTVIRFVRAFAEKEAVRVDEDSVEYWRTERAFGHSLRVPDNVIPIREGARA